MASFNKVILVGNITRTPELRQIPSGISVTDITLAVNDRRKSATGEWIEEVSFVDVTLWGRWAENVCQYTSKGSPLLVEGRLKQDTWESDGQKRSKLKVIGERTMLMPGGGSRSDDGGYSRQNNAPKNTSTRSAPPAQHDYYDSQDGDEVPF